MGQLTVSPVDKLVKWAHQHFTFVVDELGDPTRLRINERWVDAEALVAHFATPHMAAFQKAMGEHPPKNMTLHCYEASEIPLPTGG